MKKSLFIFQILCLLLILGCSRSSKKNNEALHSLSINYNNEYASVRNNNPKEKYSTGEKVVLQVEPRNGFELNSVESEANLKRNNNIIEIEIVGDTEINLSFVKSAIETDGIFNYQYSIGEGYFIVKYLGEAREINIPSEFQGNEEIKKVVGISDEVFASKKISSVKFSSNIEHIGASAFYGNEIKALELPSKLSNLGRNAFAKNHLEEVIYKGKLELSKENHFAQNNNLDNKLKKRFQLKLLENNTWELSKYLSEEKNVNIPKEIHGVKVSIIGEASFENKAIEGLNIEEGIERIGERAFRDNKISHVYIPNSIKYIGANAFTGNTDLIFYTNNSIGKAYADNNTNISWKASENKDYVLEMLSDGKYRIIAYKGEEKELIIPEKINGIPVGHIGESAFERKGLETLKIKANLESIAKDAFAYNHLNEVKAEGETKKILDKNKHFKGNNNLDNSLKQKFELEEDQGGYKIVKYLSEEKESVVVNRYINGREVQSIGKRAFKNKGIKNLILESIYKIEESAFEKNELEVLFIPSVLQEIGDRAFKNAFAHNNDYNFVHIPQGLREIGEGAFEDNSTVVFLGDNTKAMEYAEDHDYILSFYDANTVTKGEDIIGLYKVEHWADGYGISSYLGTSREIVIPKTLNGRPVYYIGEGAFAGRGLGRLIIPEDSNIGWIGANAFTGNNLREVVLSTDIFIVEPMSIFAYEETIKDYARLLAFVSKSMYHSFSNKEDLKKILDFLLGEEGGKLNPYLGLIKKSLGEVLTPIKDMIPETLIVDFIKKIVESPYIRDKILELGKGKVDERLGALEVFILEKLVEVLADLKNSSFDEGVRTIRRLGANYFETKDHTIEGISGLKITKYNTNHKVYEEFYNDWIFDDFVEGKKIGVFDGLSSLELVDEFIKFQKKIKEIEEAMDKDEYLDLELEDISKTKIYIEGILELLKGNEITKDFILDINKIYEAGMEFLNVRSNLEYKYFKDIEVPSRIAGQDVIAIGEGAFDRSNFRDWYNGMMDELFSGTTRGSVKRFIEAYLEAQFEDELGTTCNASTCNADNLCDDCKERDIVVSAGYKPGTLTNIRLPNTLIEIGDRAFYYNSLVSIDIPSSVRIIGDEAFRENRLKSINFRGEGLEEIEEIGEKAFYLNRLEKVTFPKSIKEIKVEAFRYNNLEEIKFLAFDDRTIEHDFKIRADAFRQNRNLREIYLPDNTASIGKTAFYFSPYVSLVGSGRKAVQLYVRENTWAYNAANDYCKTISSLTPYGGKSVPSSFLYQHAEVIEYKK